MDDLNMIDPLDIIGGLAIKGVMLGVMLFVAWPTKLILDRGALLAYAKAKDAMRPKVRVQVDKKLLE